MARQTKSRGGSRNGRSASQKTEKYRFAQNVGGDATMAEREYRSYASADGGDPGAEPDVLLDVPVVKVDSIHFELDDLDAHVALKAEVLDLVKLNVGVDVHLGRVVLDIKGVEAQALLKVRLDHVAAIVDRVCTTLDRNPELIKSLGKAVEDVGSGAGKTLDKTGDAVEDVGEGAEGAVQDVGEGAGQAVGDVGEGAGQAVGQIGEGAGQAVGDIGQGAGQGVGEIGQGAGQAVGDLGQGAGQAVGNLDQTVGGLGQTAGELGQGAGQAVGGLGQGAGQAAGQLGQAAGGLTGAAGQLGQGGGGGGEQQQGGNGQQQGGDQAGQDGQPDGAQLPTTSGQLAKQVAKTLAKEIGAAASDEAKELGLTATRKAKELGERRRHKRADKHHATEAALRMADECGLDLDSVEGTGAEGRITVKDVREAVEA